MLASAGMAGGGATAVAATSAGTTSAFTASGAAIKPGTINPGATNRGSLSLAVAKPADASKLTPVAARLETPSGTRAPTEADLRTAQAASEKRAFEAAAEQIRQAVQGDPALAELSRQLAIDITPEGLRIQLLDEDRLPMFATGSSTPNERARLLLAKVAPVLMRLPEDIAVVGHTDAAAYTGNGKTNWELSTERANATRRLLTDAGLAESRVSRVTGLADRDPLLPANPLAAANRRIAIIVLRGTEKLAEPAATQSVPPSVAAPASPSSSHPAASFGPPSVAGAAPSSVPPSIAAPARPSAAQFAPPSIPPSAPPSTAPSASVSAPPSTTPPSTGRSGPSSAAEPDPAADPASTPSFVPSFVPQFAPPSRSSSAAAAP